MGKRKGNTIAGQFIARPVAMLECPAYKVLSRAAHQVLARLEIEHAHHGGVENGRLPVTFDQFVKYGLHRHAVAPAIRELAALGLIEITVHGRSGSADYARPNQFRLTYRNAAGEIGDGTHDWRKIATIQEAEAIADRARKNADPLAVAKGQARAKKFSPVPVSASPQ
jgi:hypothetical protein